MRKSFHVPQFYKSAPLVQLKRERREADPKRKDLSPSVLDLGPVRFKIARHFGFCFGVENAIDIAYRAIKENAGRRIFLLSEMIHNPDVNSDLESRGVEFLMRTDGTRLVDFTTLGPQDVVIVPAFGTTLELQRELASRGIDPYFYDTTCPFVQKVWKRAEELGKSGYTVIVHGKKSHEETRATFSHSRETAPTMVLLNLADAEILRGYILGAKSLEEFTAHFTGCLSEGFDAEKHLERVGVVNQTTMLATETQAIADIIRDTMLEKYGASALNQHFADTRDTLCYATYENQGATRALIDTGADVAIVVGGYNSSNTSHLVELAVEHMPTFYVKNAGEIISAEEIRHFDINSHQLTTTAGWLPRKTDGVVEVALTSGASCPDRTVEEVIARVASFFGVSTDAFTETAAQGAAS